MESYLTEIKQLIAAYGMAETAKFLGVTERTVAYWIAETGRKVPNDRKKEQIHELFMQWKSGVKPEHKGKSELQITKLSALTEVLLTAVVEVVSATSGENPAVIRKKFEKAAEELAKMG